MILSRIASALRRQDWTQVTIELLIVVVGIYLGFQLTAWDDQRKAAAEQVDYLERLLVDADNSILDQQDDLEANEERYQGLQTAVIMLYENNLTEDNHADFVRYSNVSGGRSSLNFYRDTLDEMIASGRLANVASAELKKTIAEFREMMRTVGVVNDTLGRQIGAQTMEVRLRLKLNPQRTMSIALPEEQNNNDELYIRLNDLAYMFQSFNTVQHRYHQQTIKFRNSIAEELERLR